MRLNAGLGAVHTCICCNCSYLMGFLPAVYDYQFSNSEGIIFNKLVFISW